MRGIRAAIFQGKTHRTVLHVTLLTQSGRVSRKGFAGFVLNGSCDKSTFTALRCRAECVMKVVFLIRTKARLHQTKQLFPPNFQLHYHKRNGDTGNGRDKNCRPQVVLCLIEKKKVKIYFCPYSSTRERCADIQMLLVILTNAKLSLVSFTLFQLVPIITAIADMEVPAWKQLQGNTS